MKQQHVVIVLFALILASSLTSLDSYRTTKRIVSEDMDRALTLTMLEQHNDIISQDTIRTFNSHLQIVALRGKATLAVDTHSPQFKAYAQCSEATIFSMSDQRYAALLWMLTAMWTMFVWHRRKLMLPPAQTIGRTSFGELTYSEAENCFYAADGNSVPLTPMQHQLMEMFFTSPAHKLTKAEICATLWPGKPDASETLYTLIKRLKPVVAEHSNLKIESDRGKAYRLTIKQQES